MKFEIIVKDGLREVAHIKGREVGSAFVDIDKGGITNLLDGKQVIETEQFLEKLTGLRFHINSNDR